MSLPIPIHDFTKDDESSIPFAFQSIKGKSGYDTTVPHRHNFYEIFIFTQGGGVHEIDFHEIPIHSRSVHFISPGQVHNLDHTATTKGWLLIFSRDFFAQKNEERDILFEMPFLNNATAHPYINLNEKDFAEILKVVDSIQEEYHQSEEAVKRPVLNAYLNILLMKCNLFFTKLKGEMFSNNTDSFACRFNMLLENNFKNMHLVKQYAGMLNITPEYLTERIKLETGKTPSRLISDRIILEAKRLLLYSEYTTKQISAFLNYEDASYFSRVFKNETGYSPTEFRKVSFEKYQPSPE